MALGYTMIDGEREYRSIKRLGHKEASMHTTEFVSAATSEDGVNGMLDAAKALAMTVVDLLASPETIIKVKKKFGRRK